MWVCSHTNSDSSPRSSTARASSPSSVRFAVWKKQTTASIALLLQRNSFERHSMHPRSLCRGQTPRSAQRCIGTRRGEGSDPFARPTAIASQRTIPLEGWGEGEEEQGTRAAPDDLLTSYPGTGREERPARPHPHLPGRLFGQLTDPGRSRTFGIATSGPRIGAWMVCPPCQARFADCGPRLLC